MRKFSIYIVAFLICSYIGMTTVAHADYPKKVTTTSPYINIKRPKDDPRWAKAFSHWDKRSSTKEVVAALAIVESISKDKPDDVLTNVWLARIYYQMAMRKRKKRDFYGKKGMAASEKVLAKDPDNIAALFWRNTSMVLIRVPTEAEYQEMRDFNDRFAYLRELPVPKNDPLWAQAMKLWDNRLTDADMKKIEAGLKAKKGKIFSDEDTKFIKAKGITIIKIFEKLDKKYPNRIEPKLWLLRSHYWMSQVSVDPKNRGKWGKTGMQWGNKALAMEPHNPAANFFTASSIAEYGMGSSLTVIVKYSRQMGREILLLAEENPNYMYGGFSRFFGGAIAAVGNLVFRVAEFLGFPKPLIERLTTFATITHPKYAPNPLALGVMYERLGKEKQAQPLYKKLLKSDPCALKHQEPENRLIYLVVKYGADFPFTVAK